MKVNREKLREVLAKVQPGLAGKTEVIEQSQSFVFTDGRVMTFNDEIAVSAPLASGITGAVKGDELLKLLNKVTDEVLELEAGEEELLFKGKKLRAGIRMETEITLPLEEIKPPPSEEFITLPETFSEGLRFCMFSASTDRDKQVLCCLKVEGQYILSCDNFRLTRYDMGKKGADAFQESALIPARAAQQLIGYKPTSYGRSPGWLHFQTEGGVIFSCRTIGDDYPKVEKLLVVEGDTLELPPDMKDILNRAEIFAKGEMTADSRIEIAIEDDKMMITGRGDYGWLKEKARVKHGKGSAKFEVHPQFLTDILDLLHTVTIGGTETPRLKMEGENFIHVASLIATKK